MPLTTPLTDRSETFNNKSQVVLSLAQHIVVVGSSAPAVIAAYTHLRRVDVDGDFVTRFQVALMLSLLKILLGIRPGVEAERRVKSRYLNLLTLFIGELYPTALSAVALFAGLGIIIGIKRVRRLR